MALFWLDLSLIKKYDMEVEEGKVHTLCIFVDSLSVCEQEASCQTTNLSHIRQNKDFFWNVKIHVAHINISPDICFNLFRKKFLRFDHLILSSFIVFYFEVRLRDAYINLINLFLS